MYSNLSIAKYPKLMFTSFAIIIEYSVSDFSAIALIADDETILPNSNF